jgi:anti-sigma regulatory factor (Ser/Thr protein kinase)
MQIVVLLASELVSNAVKHANAALIEIRCEVVPQSVRIEVVDAGPGFDAIPSVRNPDAVGGWGLHLVDELSTRWGVVDATGARVWFEIDR